ncbi:dihydropteroate synthase [Temperatibacter marinus]|uniref:Dihydropteroate synthase n=1 Tax=Temperatibacter marinus TaxID=1456591 RepID=A0AA52EHZ9_9PROT|nr:dihydropteroate synthase [Temperatibacter marinus]WND02892.1 dihydropteroate synthase [Temperatibacter marinus]
MQTNDLKHLPEGARVYLVPSLPIWGDERSLRLGSTGLGFRSVRVIIRTPETPAHRVFDEYLLWEEVDTLHVSDSIREQINTQLSHLRSPRSSLKLEDVTKDLSFLSPLIMGVLNVTPDSFSDGGDFIDPEHAIVRARRMIAEGADIIDIGGESTRPGAAPVWEGDEAERVIPVILALAKEGVPLSIDTRHSFVMEEALKAGATIINDVSALTYDPESLAVAAQSTAPVILMHSKGESKQQHIYDDVVLDVYDYLAERREVCLQAGISKDRIILDPGIGFGKRVVEDNMALMNSLSLFHSLGSPVLLGASRKRFIGAVTGVEQAKDRMPGSLASALKAFEQGVQIVRVHDVSETKQALKLIQGLHDHALMDQPGLRAERKAEVS